MRPRTPEPMAMGDADAVAAFDATHPILQAPIHRLNALALSRLLPDGGRLLDLGSGSGRLLIDLARGRPDVRVAGVELAETMVAAAGRAIADAGLHARVEVRRGDMTAVEDPRDRVDVVSCVWALHHLPDRDAALRALREMARLRDEHGAALWIFDFARLPEAGAFRAIVDQVPGVPARLYEDAVASEASAWSARELVELLEHAGLGDLEGGAERRIGHLQAWTTAAPRRGPRWRGPALEPPAAEELLARLTAGLPALRPDAEAGYRPTA